MRLSAKVIAALEANDVAKLRSLKESGLSLGLCDKFGNNLLHLAIHHSTFEAFEYLLTLDEIDKNEVNWRYSPLMYALENLDDNPVYAIKLIESGCEFSMWWPDGFSSIHQAVWKDWPEVVELLIEKGVAVDMKSALSEETPLHVAAKLRHIDIIWMLLFYGADPNITSRANFTFFDLIYTEALLDQFSNFDKRFNLVTFVIAMDDESDIFYRLINVACGLNYDYQDLNEFARFLSFNPRMFMIFVRKFGYATIEEVFRTNSLLQSFYFNYSIKSFENCCANLFMLMESGIISTNLDELNNYNFLSPLIRYSKEEIELLTQIVCALLSYGMTISSPQMEELYRRFGYCDLFKIMLHMDITQPQSCQSDEDAWPGIIYHVDMNVNDVVYFRWHFVTGSRPSLFFTVPELDNRVPSLVELARNASRSYIIDRYQTKNTMQFYTILKWLPFAEEHKKIISFERELYPVNEDEDEEDSL